MNKTENECRNADKGLCFFQAILVGDRVKTAQASFEQIRRAASALILQCVASGTGESTGGIASNIGRQDQTVPLVKASHDASLFLGV